MSKYEDEMLEKTRQKMLEIIKNTHFDFLINRSINKTYRIVEIIFNDFVNEEYWILELVDQETHERKSEYFVANTCKFAPEDYLSVAFDITPKGTIPCESWDHGHYFQILPTLESLKACVDWIDNRIQATKGDK